MTQDIKATGYIGIAFETGGAGIYATPTKYFPFHSESMKYTNDDQQRRLIQGIADTFGEIGGPFHVEGDIDLEALPDVLPYFIYASRNTVVKTGTNPYTYTTTPKHSAFPTTGRTLSVTVVKGGVAMGYTGCIVSQISFTTDNGVLNATFSLIGRNESDQSVPTYSATNQAPFSHGMYTMGSPTGTTVNDVDSWTFTANDNAAPQNRHTNTRAATFVNYGEREVTLDMSRDWTSRVEYDEFKALTERSVRVQADNGASAQLKITLPRTTKDNYDIDGLDGQGDLIMAAMTYHGHYDPVTSKSYELVVISTENVS